MKFIHLLLLLLFSISFEAHAQEFNQLPDLGGNLDDWYNSVAGNLNAPALQGTYYFITEEEQVSATETPFYKDTWDQRGTLFFQGRTFTNLNMIYNLTQDVVLIWSYKMNKSQIKSLLINQAEIDSFIVHNETFLNFKHAKIGEDGFYRKVMVGNNIACFTKEKKTGEFDGLNYEYDSDTKLLIKYQNQVYTYRRVSSLYKILPEYKKKIKRFIKQNSVAIRKNEKQLIEVLDYCDTLL